MPIYVQLPNYSQGPLLLSLKTRLFATLTRIKGLPMLERLFRLSEHNTNVKTEVLAGITTFLTMSYIIFVNPDILSSTGMDRGAVFVATCLAAVVGTMTMALVANWPIGLAPGMGLNAFFAFTVVGALGFTWQQALGSVFRSEERRVGTGRRGRV